MAAPAGARSTGQRVLLPHTPRLLRTLQGRTRTNALFGGSVSRRTPRIGASSGRRAGGPGRGSNAAGPLRSPSPPRTNGPVPAQPRSSGRAAAGPGRRKPARFRGGACAQPGRGRRRCRGLGVRPAMGEAGPGAGPGPRQPPEPEEDEAAAPGCARRGRAGPRGGIRVLKVRRERGLRPPGGCSAGRGRLTAAGPLPASGGAGVCPCPSGAARRPVRPVGLPAVPSRPGRRGGHGGAAADPGLCCLAEDREAQREPELPEQEPVWLPREGLAEGEHRPGLRVRLWERLCGFFRPAPGPVHGGHPSVRDLRWGREEKPLLATSWRPGPVRAEK